MIKALILVFLGGGLGTVLRFLIGKLTLSYSSIQLPLATFIANLISCLLLAFVLYIFQAKSEVDAKMINLFLVIGFCGGLSTFSTFSLETFELLKSGFVVPAILNILFSVAMGLGSLYFVFLRANQ